MMAIQTVDYIGADGVTVTEALSGYDSKSVTGGTFVFESDWAPHGASVSILATGTTTSGVAYLKKNITATNTISFDIPVTPKALPAGEVYFAVFSSGTGTTRCFALATTATGLIRVRDAANANAWSSAAGALIVDSPCIISLYATRDAAAGTFRVVVYEADGTTIRVDSGVQTAKNTGAAQLEGFFLGSKASTAIIASTWLYGEPRWDVTTASLLPAWAPVAPSPVYRWNGSAYVPLNSYRWDGSAYVALDRATP